MSTAFKVCLILLCLSVARFIDLQPAHAASFSAVQNGSWYDSATWGGGVPTASDDVTIPVGITVTIPNTASPLSMNAGTTLTLAGTLIVQEEFVLNGTLTNSGEFYNGATVTN